MSNYHKQDKGGNLFSAIEHQQSVASREIGILKLREIIDWEGFRPLLEELCDAEVHDSRVFEQLLDEKDQAVLADSAYYSEENERHVLEEINAEEYLMRKAYRNRPLSEAEIKTNHTISRMRVRVEHVFGRMAHMGADLCGNVP